MLNFKGVYTLEQFRDGRLINKITLPNGIVNQGKNNVLDVMFNNSSQTDPWYIGLIDAAGFSALASTDTLASHPGWSEAVFTGARQAWSPAAAANQRLTDTATFTMTGAGTVKGIFLCDQAAGSAGILWSTALSPVGDVAVIAADTLNIQYDLSIP